MKIVILNDGASDSRVSASPETVKKINEMNHAVYLQKGAGIKSNFLDQDYEENGAKIFELIKFMSRYITLYQLLPYWLVPYAR